MCLSPKALTLYRSIGWHMVRDSMEGRLEKSVKEPAKYWKIWVLPFQPKWAWDHFMQRIRSYLCLLVTYLPWVFRLFSGRVDGNCPSLVNTCTFVACSAFTAARHACCRLHRLFSVIFLLRLVLSNKLSCNCSLFSPWDVGMVWYLTVPCD